MIDFLQATPQQWNRQGGVEPSGLALDTEDVDTSEPQAAMEDLVPVAAGAGVPKVRCPWLSAQTRWEMGRTPGCKGCEAIFITGQSARPHSQECWDRITCILESTEEGQATLARYRERLEQYQSRLDTQLFDVIMIILEIATADLEKLISRKLTLL